MSHAGCIAAMVAGLLAMGEAARAQPNVLLILADDVGVDRVAVYGEHPDPGHTPVLDQLAAEGILFRNATSNPYCSATRATILTGRYSFRTGIGTIVEASDTVELSIGEITIPKILRPAYHTAAVGKWHLAAGGGSGPAHPMLVGFEHHHGSLYNFTGATEDYFQWTKNVDGTLATSTTYATTDTVDEALALIAQFSSPPDARPWFVWVAFNAAHKPYHKPPASLHTFSLPDEINDEPLFMKALTEAMDTEIGRLLGQMDAAVRANTVVIFAGDNGTAESATTAPFLPSHAKTTVFEGGTNVPLIISGPGIAAGAECNALVNTVDLFATVAEIAGVPSAAEDSVSLVPYFADPAQPSLRSWAFAELFTPSQTMLIKTRHRAVRGERYKLVRSEHFGQIKAVAFYDLLADPFEQTDLLPAGLQTPEEVAAYHTLSLLLDDLEAPHGTWVDHGSGLAGTNGVPMLTGVGDLVAGNPVQIRLTGALPLASATLIIGSSYVLLPFHGGVLVPAPNLLLPNLTVGSQGQLALGSTWPPGTASGTTLYFQCWIDDPGGIAGSAASNALSGTVP